MDRRQLLTAALALLAMVLFRAEQEVLDQEVIDQYSLSSSSSASLDAGSTCVASALVFDELAMKLR